LRNHPEVRKRILEYPGPVMTSTGHWGTLVHDRPAPNWILNQCDADVDFWRVYARQARHPASRAAASINFLLARHHYPRIYSHVGRIISVCEEDRQSTLELMPTAQVDVIENGVDCSYYVSKRVPGAHPPRLLFSGTSVPRNMTALRQFGRDIWPLVLRDVPDVELLIAGDFRPEAQAEFKPFKGIRFTGKVEDIRPFFNQSDVFISPFKVTHGSKLKIAEAMSMGMAIVSTPQGVRGFTLVDGESVLIAHSDQEFAVHIIALLRDRARRERMGIAARNAALAAVDWRILGKRLITIVEAARKPLK
jgi:polysaccharide biosynthesis protein PslH